MKSMSDMFGKIRIWSTYEDEWYAWLRRSVRSCSQTIPKKVRNSRPINMGFKGWDDCYDGPEWHLSRFATKDQWMGSNSQL